MPCPNCHVVTIPVNTCPTSSGFTRITYPQAYFESLEANITLAEALTCLRGAARLIEYPRELALPPGLSLRGSYSWRDGVHRRGPHQEPKDMRKMFENAPGFPGWDNFPGEKPAVPGIPGIPA